MQPIPKDIIITAEKLLHYNNLLIAQCDSWLSAEEGNRNMQRAIEERRYHRRGDRKGRPYSPITIKTRFLALLEMTKKPKNKKIN